MEYCYKAWEQLIMIIVLIIGGIIIGYNLKK